MGSPPGWAGGRLTRAGLPAATEFGAVLQLALGPAPLVSQLVASAAADVVAQLQQRLVSVGGSDEPSRDELRQRRDEVAAWMTTYVDALTVEWFSFEPGFSPVP
jgi:hypothetical protein